jgi:hypothetical protein
MLHLHGASIRHPQPCRMYRDLQVQTDAWLAHARDVALAVPSVDYVGWHGEHFVVVRHNHHHHGHHHHRHNHHHHSSASGACGIKGDAANGVCVELKELPVRRRLDCGKGVDLGGDDAMWMERKDVPIDYEMSGLES